MVNPTRDSGLTLGQTQNTMIITIFIHMLTRFNSQPDQ